MDKIPHTSGSLTRDKARQQAQEQLDDLLMEADRSPATGPLTNEEAEGIIDDAASWAKQHQPQTL